jgi:hypothetical protein
MDDRKATINLLEDLSDDVASAILGATIPEKKISELTSKITDAEKKISELSSKLTDAEKKTGKRKYTVSDKPRRTSGYLLFCKDFRETARGDDDKAMKPRDIIKLSGEKWSQFNEEEKNVWLEKSNELFICVVEKYKETHPDYDPDAKREKKARVGATSNTRSVKIPVPRAKSPYMLFVAGTSKSSIEAGQNLSEFCSAKWAMMNEDEKADFVALAEVSKNDAIRFRAFSAGIKDTLLAEGVEDTKKTLNSAAAKRWAEKNSENEPSEIPSSNNDDVESFVNGGGPPVYSW